jgi:hypothetical protein
MLFCYRENPVFKIVGWFTKLFEIELSDNVQKGI